MKRVHPVKPFVTLYRIPLVLIVVLCAKLPAVRGNAPNLPIVGIRTANWFARALPAVAMEQFWGWDYWVLFW